MPLTKFNPADFKKNVKATFSDEIFNKANSLNEPQKTTWEELFYRYYPNKVLYEELLTQIVNKTYDPENITDIISNKKNSLDTITKQENELLQMLYGSSDNITITPLEEVIEKAKALSGQGSVSIRPPIGSNYTPTKPRPRKVRP